MARYLSQRQAERCEQAVGRTCSCRCGGALHGAARVPNGGDFSALSADDPHYRGTTKDAALKLLRHSAGRITAEAGEFFRRDWDQAWRDALEIIGNAIKEVKSGAGLREGE